MSRLPVNLYLSDALGAYGFGDPHPFGTDRMAAFYRETLKQSLHKRVNILAPVSCKESDLTRFHTPRYVE